MAFGRILLAWVVVGAWLAIWAFGERRVTGGPGPSAAELAPLAGEALLLALFAGLWFGSLGSGGWWLVFLLLGGADGVAGALPGRGGAHRPRRRGRCAPGLDAPSMSPTALERLALYFGVVRTRQGILARAALGTPGAGDAALAQELAAGDVRRAQAGRHDHGRRGADHLARPRAPRSRAEAPPIPRSRRCSRG